MRLKAKAHETARIQMHKTAKTITKTRLAIQAKPKGKIPAHCPMASAGIDEAR